MANQETKPDLAVESQEVSLESGFTWRSLLALFFSSATLVPMIIYVSLVSGALVATAAVYITAFLFSGISRLLNAPMRRQEMFIVYTVTAVAVSVPFLGFVYRGYFVESRLTSLFTDPATGQSVSSLIPEWYAPRQGSESWINRSFMYNSWLFPIALATLQYGVLWTMQEFAITFICAHLYINTENLPFPFASIDAQMVITLTERDPNRMRIFALSAIPSIVYSIILYAIPMVTAGAVTLIPVPWVDLTSGLIGIEKALPGACLGVSTDPLWPIWGFLVAPSVVAYILIGSISVWVFANWAFLNFFSAYFSEWAEEWVPGMSMQLIYQRASLRIWISPLVSFTIAVAVLTIMKGRHYFIRSFKGLMRLSPSDKEAGYFSLPFLLLMYFGAIGVSAAIFHVLVPGFPVWPTLAVTALSFIGSLASVRAVGETGFAIGLPYAWQGLVILSGYSGLEPWLISPAFSGALGSYSFQWNSSPSGASQFARYVKAAYLTRTRIRDYFKAYIPAFVLSSVFSFIYMSFIWSMAPIPSYVFPSAQIFWPVSVLTQGLWMTKQIVAFKPEFMLGSFGFMLVLGIVGEVIMKFTRIPFSIIGLVIGAGMLPAYSITVFIGSIIGNYVIKRYLGAEWWERNRSVIVAGIFAGEGIVLGISAVALMMLKATWLKPY